MPGDAELAATRAAYDATAELYVRSIGTEISDSIEAAVDRSILQEFSSLFSCAALVADLGCGPGRAGAVLAQVRAAGFSDSAVVGRLSAGPPRIRIVEGEMAVAS